MKHMGINLTKQAQDSFAKYKLYSIKQVIKNLQMKIMQH